MLRYVVEVIFSDVSKDHNVFTKHSKNKYVYAPVVSLHTYFIRNLTSLNWR